ncbi:MAG TPA: GNAT family N-acetyltransferase [Ktedonobacterales bacterium]
MTPFTVRAARLADLPAVHDIWYHDEIADDPQPPAQGPVLSGFTYELEHGAMRVAEDDAGALIGFGGSVGWDGPRGSLTYLADLFIAQQSQSHGVGQALLAALPLRAGARCVHASHDARASALYIRWGMRPLWPNYWLVADPQWGAHGLATLPGAGIELAAPDDPELAAWDTRHFGYARPRDLAWLVSSRDAQPLWFRRGGKTIGYGYVQRRCGESLWRPEAWTVGPIGAETPEDARDCVCAATRWAAGQAGVARLGVPGPHPALPPLIEAGCRIVYIETFLASDTPAFDATRYLPSGVFL